MLGEFVFVAAVDLLLRIMVRHLYNTPDFSSKNGGKKRRKGEKQEQQERGETILPFAVIWWFRPHLWRNSFPTVARWRRVEYQEDFKKAENILDR